MSTVHEKIVTEARITENFGDNWQFHLGDIETASNQEFDDSGWRAVSLPHDWSIDDLPDEQVDEGVQRSGPFDSRSEGAGDQGYTLGGVGWYRKTFTVPADQRGKRIFINFDGIYMQSEVWLNGHKMIEHPYGYTSFTLDMTAFLNQTGKNVLAVKVNSSGKTSRWYSGSGIYRQVKLWYAGNVHIEPDSVAITTPEINGKIELHARVTVKNNGSDTEPVNIAFSVLDPDGTLIVAVEEECSLQSGKSKDMAQVLIIPNPMLWSPETPALYRLAIKVRADGAVSDSQQTTFGCRTIRLDPQLGFLLNGEVIQLRGGCIHHDNGCLGSCSFERAEERKVELLKSAGYNAIRTSHNPPSTAMLNACDRLGMLVMDEAFDCWEIEKKPEDYHLYFLSEWQKDLKSMVERDRCHPSVVFWSTGNEIPQQAEPEGAVTGGMLASYIRELDPSRPVAVAAFPFNELEKLDDYFAQVDLAGYNYMPEHYASTHERLADRMIAGTESFPMKCFESWMGVIDHPWVIGDFVWTAFDYIGEAGLGKEIPADAPDDAKDDRVYTISNCGDFDHCGFRRPPSFYREIVWGCGTKIACFVQTLSEDGKRETKIPMWNWGWLDERPSWTWPDREGKLMELRVFSRCAKVRLMLNDISLGEKLTNRDTEFIASWQLPYTPGVITAIGLDAQRQEEARAILQTAGAPASLLLSADRKVIDADGQDLSYITVEVQDNNGVICPNADNLLHFTLSGPGRIIGVGNGDPMSLESFQQHLRKAYRGKALVVIQSGKYSGELKLTAESEGLKEAQIMLEVK